MKKSTIYTIIVILWLILVITFANDFIAPIARSYQKDFATFLVVLISTLFVLYFWLNGLKDIIYTIFYYCFFETPWGSIPSTLATGKSLEPSTVELLYCTYNDFSPESLLESMKQDYQRFSVVILDDSTDEAYKQRVDEFAKAHDIKVIRRDDHAGYKAGNMNNYLKSSTAEFFAILDSDEIIPPDFITKSLIYMQDPQTAVVQGNHAAINNRNDFMSRYADGVESHWNTYQAIKNEYGFLSFLGHGALIRKSAYDEVGGFPYLVAEDLCFSIELRNKGYFVKFAQDILCSEEYPVSYLAFKKRHAKWTMGNMEFVQKYTGRVLGSNMRWFEKLDIFLFTYSLPLSVMFVFYLTINVIILPLMHFTMNYSMEMLLPTIAFLFSPLLNDIIYYFGKKKKRHIIHYSFASLLLYGSMFWVSFKSAFQGLFGKAVFLVTPKEDTHISFKQALFLNWEELLFALILSVISIDLLQSILPVLLIVLPSLASVQLSLLSNKKSS